MQLEYVDIIDAVQYTVDKIAKEQYKKDQCPPKFIVSQLDKYDSDGKIITHEIVITIKHNSQQRTRSLFPRPEYKFGYEPLSEEMRYLYNSTM